MHIYYNVESGLVLYQLVNMFINATPHSHTGKIPCEILYGCNLYFPIDIVVKPV